MKRIVVFTMIMSSYAYAQMLDCDATNQAKCENAAKNRKSTVESCKQNKDTGVATCLIANPASQT